MQNTQHARRNPETLFSPLIERAIELSAEWHDQTYRKSRWRNEPFEPPPNVVLHVPMMAHVTAVALTVQRAGWEDEVVAAAFLHDVLEDANRFRQGMLPEQLAALVGEDVVALVAAVTEPKRDDAGNPLPWRVRKEAYLAALAAGPPGAAAISLADKLHNAWTMCEGLAASVDIFSPTPYRRALSAGPEAQRWFLRAVLDVTCRHADPRLEPMRARLDEEIARFEQATRTGEAAERA
jgi:(p)ppGpp synthase/HD superfamily hydrolase